MIFEKIKEILCKPLVVILSLFLAIGSIAAYMVINNTNQSKVELLSTVDFDTIEKDKETGKYVAKRVDYKQKQKENLEAISSKFDEATHPDKEMTDKIDSYIQARYGFDTNSSARDNLSTVLAKIATSSFATSSLSSFDEEKLNSSKVSIIKRFVRALKTDGEQYSVNVLRYVYAIEINGIQKLMNYEMTGSNGEWKINSEKAVASLEGNKAL